MNKKKLKNELDINILQNTLMEKRVILECFIKPISKVLPLQ